MSYTRFYKRIYFLLAIISWLSLFPADFIHYITSNRNFDLVITTTIRDGILIFFVLMVLAYYNLEIYQLKETNFIKLLKRTFYTALILSAMLGLNIIIHDFYTQKYLSPNFYIYNMLYHISVGLAAVYLGNTFFVFSRMILYQKSKLLVKIWNVFKYLLLSTIILSFIPINQSGILFYMLIAPVLILTVYLCLKVKWVAYLNFKLKWEGIVYLICVLASGLFIGFHLYEQSRNHTLIIDISEHVFPQTIFLFIFLYSLISILVTLFNLPTTSVFEQKFDEVLNFQKLSNSFDLGKSEEEIYETLLDSCKTTISADAACLEIFNDKGNPVNYICKNTDKEEIYKVKTALRKNKIQVSEKPFISKNLHNLHFNNDVKNVNFKSFALLPLISHKGKIGNIYLFSSIEDVFEKEILEIIKTYVNQAGISISNYRLVNEVVENAIYKEELEIAKKVQRSLIPEDINHLNDFLEISTFSKSANEVGGDYYDYFSLGNNRYAFVIGDVSGKGTSAAFHMAQLKGVFHSLIQLEMETREFMKNANQALSRCLNKHSFITLTLVIIDWEQKTIEISRAGHCPTLYYTHKQDVTNYIEDDGMGLGIVRSDAYTEYIYKHTGKIASQDILFLYTDGIIETKNPEGEEFGYHRLRNFLYRNKMLSSTCIKDKLIEELFSFSGRKEPNDDYSALIIKFN